MQIKRPVLTPLIRRILLIGGSVILVLVLLSPLLFLKSRTTPQTVTAPPRASPTTTPASALLITAAGDMLAHDSVNQNAKTASGYDYTPFFSEVETYTRAGDIRFCNQEGLSAGAAFGISGYPNFNAPTELPRDLNKIGCNAINLANNHMADKGQAAVEATLDAWKGLSTVAVVGANRSAQERDLVHYIDLKGSRVAMVGFNEANNNKSAAEHLTTLLTDENVTKLMTEARAHADFVMVSVHWSSYEDSSQVGTIETQWVDKLAGLGADLIIGTGPHVLQRAEWKTKTDGKRAFVYYSIGNFLSTQLTLKELIGGLAIIKLEKKDGVLAIQKVGFLPTYMHYDWPSADANAEKLSTRTNLKLYPLTPAIDDKLKTRFSTDAASQLRYVGDTLGSDITLVTPETFSSF